MKAIWLPNKGFFYDFFFDFSHFYYVPVRSADGRVVIVQVVELCWGNGFGIGQAIFTTMTWRRGHKSVTVYGWTRMQSSFLERARNGVRPKIIVLVSPASIGRSVLSHQLRLRLGHL